jgi:CRP-like cAMP-binding protein
MRPVEGIMLTAERRDIERSFASAPAVAVMAPPSADESELGILDAVGSVMLLKRDATLFYEGDAADCYYKLVSGAARSCKLLPDGRRHITDFFLAGDFIGFHALDTHGCTAEAVTDAALVRYDRRVVDALVARSPRVGKSLLARVCAELSEARSRMLMLGRMNARERLASFLLGMAARNRRELCDTIPLPMTRSDIGDYLGLTTETVCRTLAQLRKAGMIAAPSPHELRLLQPRALAVLARGG